MVMARLPVEGWWRVMSTVGRDQPPEHDWGFRTHELLLSATRMDAPRLEWVSPPVTDFDSVSPVVVRIGVGENGAAWADLGAERVFDGVVHIDTRLKVGRLNRYRASGRDWWDD